MKKSAYIALVSLLTGLLFSADIAARKKKTPVEQVSEEQRFMTEYFTEIPCGKWEEGRSFIYLDTLMSPLLRPQRPTMQNGVSYRGKQFVFKGFSDDAMWGGGTADLVFDCEGEIFYFKTSKSSDEISNSTYAPLLPMLIPCDEIELARKLLVGRTLYTRPAVWVDSTGNARDGGRFRPVVVKDIEPGNGIYPIAFVIEAADEPGLFRIYGSLTQTSRMQAATFDRLFTFENPRKRYANISDDFWRLITRGQVAAGMTKDECRLALGRPQTVREIPTYSGLNEEWYYNTGAYLFFVDGKLSRFR